MASDQLNDLVSMAVERVFKLPIRTVTFLITDWALSLSPSTIVRYGGEMVGDVGNRQTVVDGQRRGLNDLAAFPRSRGSVLLAAEI